MALQFLVLPIKFPGSTTRMQMNTVAQSDQHARVTFWAENCNQIYGCRKQKSPRGFKDVSWIYM